jgi:hypothetical protein
MLSASRMGRILKEIARIEVPIHVGEVTAHVRALWRWRSTCEKQNHPVL